MKKDIHPKEYRMVAFKDMSNGHTWLTKSTVNTREKEVVDGVGELLHGGNVSRIIVKDDAGKTLLEIPATVGVVGVVLVPWLAALGVIAALVANCHLVVERRE